MVANIRYNFFMNQFFILLAKIKMEWKAKKHAAHSKVERNITTIFVILLICLLFIDLKFIS